MKGMAGYLVGSVVLAVLGAVCLGASRLDRQIAHAQQTLLTSDYGAADASLQVVERYYQYASRVPWVGEGPLNDVRARRAAINYWQRRYGALVPADRTDPVADVAPANVQLQLIVADAVYRDGQPRSTNRTATLQMLDSAISAYRAVLNNARRPEDTPYAEDAAYNYEYVVRLRDEIVKGRRRALPPPDDDGNLGFEGEPEDATFEREFKQYVPLEKEERENTDPGRTPPPVRKG
ncbi:MAG TPA: hypothetical protein VIX63_15555 [Vicinamibacterales bacterium]